MQFNRCIDSSYEGLLSHGKPLRFLVDKACRSTFKDTGLPLDLQLRSRNEVMLYLGLTRLLTVKLMKRSLQLKVSADKFYRLQEHGVAERYSPDEYAKLAGDVQRYLDNVVVNKHHYEKEGHCQARLASRFGVHGQSGDRWTVVDREIGIAYDDGQKEKVWDPIRSRAIELGRKLMALDPKKFGTSLAKKAFGDGLDFLLWNGKDREFGVAEVKDGHSTSGVYLSPRQVAAYTTIWRRFAADQPDEALSGLRELVLQKQRLGLLPEHIQPPESKADLRFIPVIIVRNPRFKGSVWESFDIVRRLVDKDWDGVLGGLKVYEANEEGLREMQV